MAVTIKDIAREAGVSYSTVSRALNNVGVNKESEIKKKILKIADEMGYIPNQAAINLKLSRSYVIGLYFSTISKMTSPYVLHDVITGVYSIVGNQYKVVVKGIDMHEKGTLNPSLFDGIIVLTQSNEDNEFIKEVTSKKIPIVAICRKVELDISNVATDEERAMEKAMDYLLDSGHRNIGVIEGKKGVDSTKLRHNGWIHSIEKHGLDSSRIPYYYGTYRYMSGYENAKKLLAEKPTAILCFNDEMAFGANEAIKEAGLSVPEDVSLIGFDNWDLSNYGSMKLTTVERSMSNIAKEGTKVLLELIDKPNTEPKTVLLDNKLIIRETVLDLNANKTQNMDQE